MERRVYKRLADSWLTQTRACYNAYWLWVNFTAVDTPGTDPVEHRTTAGKPLKVRVNLPDYGELVLATTPRASRLAMVPLELLPARRWVTGECVRVCVCSSMRACSCFLVVDITAIKVSLFLMGQSDHRKLF